MCKFIDARHVLSFVISTYEPRGYWMGLYRLQYECIFYLRAQNQTFNIGKEGQEHKVNRKKKTENFRR